MIVIFLPYKIIFPDKSPSLDHTSCRFFCFQGFLVPNESLSDQIFVIRQLLKESWIWPNRPVMPDCFQGLQR